MVYVNIKQLSARFGVSRQTLWRWINETDFPKPLRLTPGTTRWRIEDVEAWEQSRKEAS